jgi:hypothetical protein
MLSASSGASDQVCRVSMDTSFHGGSNGTIGGHVRLRGAEIFLV